MLKITLNQDNKQTNFEIENTPEGKKIGTECLHWDLVKIGENTFHAIYKHRSFRIELLKIDYTEKKVSLKINGHVLEYTAKNELDLLLEKMGMSNVEAKKINHLKAPMPGLISAIKVEVGQSVRKGDILLILEAMKMENAVKSPTDGIIKAILVQNKDNIEKNKVLIEFE